MSNQTESKTGTAKNKTTTRSTDITQSPPKLPSAPKKSTIPRKKVAVKATNIEPSPTIITLAKESFRFNATFENMLKRMDEQSQKRYKNSYPYFRNKIQAVIEEAGFQIVDLTNKKYEPGMSVMVMNMEDFGEKDVLYVDQMIEPIITNKSGIVSGGVILLRKGAK